MFLRAGKKKIIMRIAVEPLNMIMYWGCLWSELLKLLPKATQPMSGKDSCFVLKLFSQVHLLSAHLLAIERQFALTVSWLGGFLPVQSQREALPCPPIWNGLSGSFQSWLPGCYLHPRFLSFLGRGICPLVCQSGCFRTSLYWPLFFTLYQGSSFLLREPRFPNFTKPLPPGLISLWNCLFGDTFYPMSMNLPLSVLLRSRYEHT